LNEVHLMSEMAGSQAGPQDQTAGPFPPVSAGKLLREAREAAGLHIAALAVSLKVPVKKLEALEADRIDLLPDAVFARALAASVCRTLKTDPGPVLANLPQSNLARLPSQSGISSKPFANPGPDPRPVVRNQLSRPVVLFALALMVAAVVIMLLPAAEEILTTRTVGRVPAVTPQPAATQAAPIDATPQPPLIAATALGVGGLIDGGNANAGLANPGTATVSAVSSLASAELRPDGTPVANADLVTFKASGASWVEVLDARRVVRLRKNVAPGDTIGLSADLPMYVTVGRVDAIEVLVRGKPLDLATVTKDNVARFEVR
jgi:cytoskeleton protein RodZ